MAIEETDWDARYEENDTPWDKGEAAPAIARLVSEGVSSIAMPD